MRNGCGWRCTVIDGCVPGGGAFSVKSSAHGWPMHSGPGGAFGSGAVGGGATVVGGSVPAVAAVVVVAPGGPSVNP